MSANTSGWSTGSKIAIGSGSLLAIAAGIYLLAGKRGEKNRSRIKNWAHDMKRDVVDKLKGIEGATQRDYERIVAQVATGYRTLKGVDNKELSRISKEINQQWEHIKSEAGLLKASGKKLLGVA